MTETTACPECNNASIARTVTTQTKWRCRNCGERFDEPRRRERLHGGPRHGLAGELKRIGERRAGDD